MTPFTLLLALLPAFTSRGAQEPASSEPVEASPAEAPTDAQSEAPTSLFVDPLYLGEVPPTRSLRHVVVLHRGVPGAPVNVTRDEAEALAIAERLLAEIEEGAEFAEVARKNSEAPSFRTGGVLGTFAPGMLGEEFDEFLFDAEVGEVGGPFSVLSGVHILQRTETLAAAKQILVKGDEERARGRCLELLARVKAGEDFGQLAEVYSEDEASAARRGQLSIFERGPFDTLIKKAAFEAEVGEIVGPIQSPLGYHLVQRVPVAELDPALRERMWIRGQAILLSFEGAPDYPTYVARSEPEANRLIEELHKRILAGEDMADLAAEHNDDFGGRERRGDLGWLHRRTPRMSPILDQLYLVPAGTLLEPVRVPQGWVLLRREQ